MKNNTKGTNLDLVHHRVGLTSAKLPPKIGAPKAASSTSDFTLPPILRPLLEDHIPKKKTKREDSISKPKKHGQGALKNKESNLRETLERFPETKGMLNMRLKEVTYKDPADNLDPHKAARTVGEEVPSNLKVIEHNYSKKVKKHMKKSSKGTG
jgi:hypothetical protein